MRLVPLRRDNGRGARRRGAVCFGDDGDMNFKRLDDAMENLWGVMPNIGGTIDDDVAELYRAVLAAIRDLKAQVSRGSPGGDNGPAPANRPEPTPRPPEAKKPASGKWNLTDVEGLVKSMAKTHELLAWDMSSVVLPICDNHTISHYPPSDEITLTVKMRKKP